MRFVGQKLKFIFTFVEINTEKRLTSVLFCETQATFTNYERQRHSALTNLIIKRKSYKVNMV